MDWSRIKPELQKKLDPAHVRPAPRGKFGDYVDGYHVICEANRIFGEDGWSYEVTRLELVSEQTVNLTGKNGDYQQLRVGYLCTVKVTVGDTFKEGAAVGSGVGSPDTMADHHESAVKEAETDALKRALRSYGNTFGLALYDKSKANVGVEKVEYTDEQKRDTLKAVIQKQPTKQAVNAAWANPKFDAAFKSLPEPMQGELRKVKSDREAQVPDDPAMQAPAA